MTRRDTKSHYGPWAVIGGGSRGLGYAFAEALAARGHDIILIGRRQAALDEAAEKLRARHNREVVPLRLDLGAPEFPETLGNVIAEREVGVGVFSAAAASFGALVERPPAELTRVLDVNCRGSVLFAKTLAPAMISRGRGALILISSVAGLTGASNLAVYGASKAFTDGFARGLWAELKPSGVDVLGVRPGAIRTEQYKSSMQREMAGILEPSEVVESSLAALGKGPLHVPGAWNRASAFVYQRVFSGGRATESMSEQLASAARPADQKSSRT